jgi:PBSX family phage terminase large subunit
MLENDLRIPFAKTQRQKEAINILASDAKHCMLYGGSRSGKTFIIVYAIIIRAAKEKSRHVILRSKFNHVRTSIFMDTLPKVLDLAFPNLHALINKTDSTLVLPNGSEIWHAGLDDKQRVEKILGKEYSSIYFNESSQIEYSSISMALTRLAEKNKLKKKVYYDENPPTKSHWSYWQFIKKLDPVQNIPLKNPDMYASMLMNPNDNQENIDQDYLAMLQELPERDRNRFLFGMFNDTNDGVAYYSFVRERHVVKNVESDHGTTFIGLDFNVNPMTAVVCKMVNDRLHVIDEAYLENSDTYKMCAHLKSKGYVGTVIPDSTGANRKTSGRTDFQILEEAGFQILSTRNPYVVDRINNLNRIFSHDMIKIDDKCKKLINDLEKVGWKNGDLDEGNDKMLTHISDALGYAAWKLIPMAKRLDKLQINRIGR